MKSSYLEYLRYPTDLNILCFPLNLIVNRAHWHYALEIIVCVRGGLTVGVRGSEYHLEEGDFITIDSGCDHEIYDGTPGGQQLVFQIEESWIRRREGYTFDMRTVGEGSIDKRGKEALFVVSEIYKLAGIFRRVFNSADVEGLGRSASSEEWYEIMSIYQGVLSVLYKYSVFDSEFSKRNQTDLLVKCINLIQTEFATIESQGEVAKRLGLSIPSLHRLLETQMGVSYIKYINSVKVSAAMALLLDNKNTIVDIADQCGFSSVSSFYRNFKEYTGKSPHQYRKDRTSVNTYMVNQSILARNKWEFVDYNNVSIDHIIT